MAAAVWLAMALFVGQQAAALHLLGHAFEQPSDSKPAKPVNVACDDCFLFAGLASGGAAAHGSIPAVVLQRFVADISTEAPWLSTPRLAFRSRAPPILLA